MSTDGTPIAVNSENISQCIPFGSRIKVAAEFAYLWVLSSSQECYPVWTFVLGMVVATASQSSYDIRNTEDDEYAGEAPAVPGDVCQRLSTMERANLKTRPTTLEQTW